MVEACPLNHQALFSPAKAVKVSIIKLDQILKIYPISFDANSKDSQFSYVDMSPLVSKLVNFVVCSPSEILFSPISFFSSPLS